MPLDPSISLQAQTPNPANMISGFLDIGRKKLELNKAQDTYNADVAGARAASSSLQSQATVDAANVQPQIDQQIAVTKGAQATADTAQLENTRKHVANVVQQASRLLTDPDLTRAKVIESVFDSAASEGAPTAAIQQALRGIPQSTGNPDADKAALTKFLQNSLARAQSVGEQIGVQFPAPVMVNNGQTLQPQAMGNQAMTGVQPGTPQGATTQIVPPPTTVVFNPIKQQPELLGSRPNGVAPGSAPTAPALGVAEGVQGAVAPNVQHFDNVVKEATAAPTRIGLLQSIKALAPEAITGDAGTLKTIVSKLAAYTGWTGPEQTSTDIMAKEAAMLASKGGNTDLARTLNEAATPNGKMTKEAILKAADQLIGQEKLKVAAQQYFSGVRPDSPEYTARLQVWNKVADPRAFEYAAKSPAERAQMKFEMKKAGTWDAFNQNLHALDKLGIQP